MRLTSSSSALTRAAAAIFFFIIGLRASTFLWKTTSTLCSAREVEVAGAAPPMTAPRVAGAGARTVGGILKAVS